MTWAAGFVPATRLLGLLAATLLALLAVAIPAAAQDPASALDTGDTAWVLMASALVMLMTPGLALFYAGMVRAKNAVGTLMQCLAVMGLITLQWVVLGYTLAFGPDVGGLIGGLDFAFLRDVSAVEPNAAYAPTIPHQAFMIFQMMFAIIAPALILGAVAERVKFGAVVAFVLLWATFVYDPIAHWVWGVGGWLRALGGLDFAGGLVVHVSAGVAALACALYLGRRLGHGREEMGPHNLTLTVLGAGLLWFGWFGFNGGSAVASGSLATVAFVNTHIATAAAALAWTLIEWRRRGKPSALGAANGAVAGLVAITPACGFVTPLAAIAVGAGAGGLCYLAVRLKDRLGLDDALDAWGVHGVGGIWGAVATGLFASAAVNAVGTDGALLGNLRLLGVQLAGVLAVAVYTFAVTWALLWGIDRTIGLRVAPEHEEVGLDVTQHGETAYNFPLVAAVVAVPVAEAPEGSVTAQAVASHDGA
ncbi:MAG TPA: ammonium transporter [Candidatus Thermoplasmatota archaeon]|nr:ammonium transporter [Candidatus Thermoplasmatota archaeon]